MILSYGFAPYMDIVFLSVMESNKALIFMLFSLQNMGPKDETFGLEKQRRIIPAIIRDGFKGALAAWRNVACNTPAFVIALTVHGLYVAFQFSSLYVAEQSLAEGNNRVDFVLQMGRVGLILTLLWLVCVAMWEVLLFRGFTAKFAGAKSLMSGPTFKTRAAKFFNLRRNFYAQWVGYVILYTVFLPQPLAMQYFSITSPQSWPSPMSYASDWKSAPALLAAPLHLLFSRGWMFFWYFRWVRKTTIHQIDS